MVTDSLEFLFSYRLDPSGRGQALSAAEVFDWQPSDGHLWTHLQISEPGARRWLTDECGLPADAVHALLVGESRPRSLTFEEGLLLVLRGVNTNPGEDPEDMVSVRIWADRDRIISTRRRRLLSVIDISNALDAGKGPATPGELLAMLIERLADRIGDFVDSIESRLDEAEDVIGEHDALELRPQLAAYRRQMASVRRFLAPQRDALDRLNRQPTPVLSEADAHVMREEADRITRYLEDLDLARERAIVMQEELLAEIAQQQNSRMYVLSVVAAIFLPLTFVTGLLGMNVGGLPGVDNAAGFLYSVLAMVISGAAVLGVFRWKKWL